MERNYLLPWAEEEAMPEQERKKIHSTLYTPHSAGKEASRCVLKAMRMTCPMRNRSSMNF
jgi:hypothetical protein